MNSYLSFMPPLSPREKAVMKLVAQGCSNRAIAAQLTLAPKTIERHVSNIYKKLPTDITDVHMRVLAVLIYQYDAA